MRQGIDRLNRITKKRLSIPYEQYFGDMQISDTEKQKRIWMAEIIEDIFTELFLLIDTFIATDMDLDFAYFTDFAERRYIDTLEDLGLENDALYPLVSGIIANSIAEVIQATENNIGDSWIVSKDRAMLIAENDANTLSEYKALRDAISEGKTRKTWRTMLDNRVRHTHSIVEGETIGIYDSFKVGAYEMMYPKDTSLGAGLDEIANCRCTCSFT